MNGDWVENKADVAGLITGYFDELFFASQVDTNRIVHLFLDVVSKAESKLLLAHLKEEEVKALVFSMKPDKSPGLDRMNPMFFQRYWTLVKDDIIEACRDWFQSSIFSAHLNDTLIILIPKVDHPEQVKDYHPISLCNVTYKILAKILANRLKVVLNRIVFVSQSAFVPGRLISDNVLVAFKLIHTIQSRMKG